jgi:hypothetical protein
MYSDEEIIQKIKNQLEDVVSSVWRDEEFWGTMPDTDPDFIDAIVNKLKSGTINARVKIDRLIEEETNGTPEDPTAEPQQYPSAG